MSQKVKGGEWNYLGTYPFNAGEYTVVLSDNANGLVTADAIKFEPDSYISGSSWPIADNLDANIIGPWDSSTWADGGSFYDVDFYHLDSTNTGDNTVTWTLAVPAAGNYNVYARWTEYSNRAADALYTVNHAGGSDSVEMCQQIRGGRWNYLGNYLFEAGNYSVVLSDDVTFLATGDRITADAVMFESGSAPPHPYPISDNWDATFVGPWEGATWSDGGTPFGSDYQHKLGSGGGNSVTWKSAIPEQGIYTVYTRWSQYSNRPTDAPYTVYYEGGSDIIYVNQTANGGKWMCLGSYPFNRGAYSVMLADNVLASKRIIADAVKWEKGLVVDNLQANFSGTWIEAVDTAEHFSTNYRYHYAGSGIDTAAWTPDIPAEGDYAVYAWWCADSDRATDAPYTIHYNGGSDAVQVNQTADGGKWNYLGTYPFAAGASGSVELGQTSTGKVTADAVRWVPLTGSASSGSRLVDHIAPDHSAVSMTFNAEFYDIDQIGNVQVIGYSAGSGDWAPEDMSNPEGISWSKVLGANDWSMGNGYYFKVTDNSANVIFIGSGGSQYADEADARNDVFLYGAGQAHHSEQQGA